MKNIKELCTFLKLTNGSWIAHIHILGHEIDFYGDNKEDIAIAMAAVLKRHGVK